MNTAKRYSLVIFDWDGTIADSVAQIVFALKQSIAELGLPERSSDKLRDIIGLGLEDALMRLFPEMPLEQSLGLAERYRHHYFLNAEQPLHCFDGMTDLLDALQADDRKIAISTGKSRRGLDMALKKTGLGHYFHATRCADESHSKPNPAMIHELLKELWIDPEDAVMIGDSEYDLQMAENAGIASIGVTWGVHAREHQSQFNPFAIVDTAAELRSILAA